ncbi:MAG: helix-turn-helix domain-containing protein [Armatimonadota bacterium]
MGRHPSRRHIAPGEAPIGRRIRQRRRDLGLTQANLGGADYTKSFISQLESGDADPSLDTLRFLSRRLKTSLSALAGDALDQRLTAVEGLLLWGREAATARNAALARHVLRMAADLADEGGWDFHRAEARLALAEFEAEHGDPETAASMLAGVSELTASLGRPGAARRDLAGGLLALRRRDGVAAVAWFRGALADLKKTTRHPSLAAQAMLGLADALTIVGDLRNAARRAASAAKLAARYRLHGLHGRALLHLALLRGREGAAAEAVRLLQDAESILDGTEDRDAHIEVLIQRGRMLLDGGDDAGALEVARRAVSLADAHQDPLVAARASSVAGRALLRQRRADDALPLLARAVERMQAATPSEDLADAAEDLSDYYRSRGDHALADRYRTIAGRPRENGETPSAAPAESAEPVAQDGSRTPLSSKGV